MRRSLLLVQLALAVAHDGLTLTPAQLAAALSERYPQLAAAPATSPQQVRLAPGPAPGASMRASWATIAAVNTSDGTPRVTWWAASQGPGTSTSAPANASTYSAGETGWTGAIYTAVMAPLAPGVEYAYTVGTAADVSDTRTFTLPPRGGLPVRLAFAADMGTVRQRCLQLDPVFCVEPGSVPLYYPLAKLHPFAPPPASRRSCRSVLPWRTGSSKTTWRAPGATMQLYWVAT